MDDTELKLEMKKNHDTGKILAEFLGITPQTFVNKKKNGTFTSAEIKKLAERYGWTAERICEVFHMKGVNDD